MIVGFHPSPSELCAIALYQHPVRKNIDHMA
jgi:hypothetical protein